MNHACIHTASTSSRESPPLEPSSFDSDDDDESSVESDVSFRIQEPEPSAFCVQQFMEREKNVSFLCVWRQFSVEVVSPRAGKPSTKMKALDEIFLLRQGSYTTELKAHEVLPKKSLLDATLEDEIELQRLGLTAGDEQHTHKTLYDLGCDPDATVPLLLHMKLLTAEIVSRINRCCHSARQVVSIACEFFISSTESINPRQVVFAALSGIQWQGYDATWETLRHVDRMSKAIYESVTLTDCSKDSPSPNKRHPQKTTRSELSLTLYDELNPRFPSLQSPLVAEKQWKHKSALLPPYVSPRYVDAEMPKMYRDGHFQPLLTPRQADAVNRLNVRVVVAQPSPVKMPRHPLSRKHADVERELWARQDANERAARGLLGLGLSPPPPLSPLRSPPSSPRHRYRSIIKEELF